MAQGFIDHSQGTNNASSPALIRASKFDENKIGISATGPVNGQTLEPSRTSSVKESSLLSESTDRAATLCMQPSTFPFCGNTSIAYAGTVELTSQPQIPLSRWNMTNHAVTDDKLKDEEMSIESDTTSISTVYSQRYKFSGLCFFTSCIIDSFVLCFYPFYHLLNIVLSLVPFPLDIFTLLETWLRVYVGVWQVDEHSETSIAEFWSRFVTSQYVGANWSCEKSKW